MYKILRPRPTKPWRVENDAEIWMAEFLRQHLPLSPSKVATLKQAKLPSETTLVIIIKICSSSHRKADHDSVGGSWDKFGHLHLFLLPDSTVGADIDSHDCAS